MINGIQIEMSSDKLAAHIKLRADFHRSKATWYKQQIRSLTAGGLSEGREGHSNDPIGSLSLSQQDHEEKAAYFAVLHENLIPNETYRLSQNDLGSLEFVSRFF
jgi:hypothetical protein